LKLEHKSVEPSVLEMESELYSKVRGCTGFPNVFWYGWHDDYRVMAFDLLGPSLDDLFEFCDRRFSLKTVLMIADQLLQRLEDLHSRRVWHRDVKPQNCLLGSGVNGNVVYMTDFGLAQDMSEYADVEVAEDEVPRRPHLVGTTRYASVRAHEGRSGYIFRGIIKL
jgi:serine/threonine protein kinase